MGEPSSKQAKNRQKNLIGGVIIVVIVLVVLKECMCGGSGQTPSVPAPANPAPERAGTPPATSPTAAKPASPGPAKAISRFDKLWAQATSIDDATKTFGPLFGDMGEDWDEFKKREYTKRLPALRKAIGASVYRVDAEATVGEYDFKRKRFPISVEWPLRIGDVLFFTKKPTVAKTKLPSGTAYDWHRYHSTYSLAMDEQKARAWKQLVGRSPISARLIFRVTGKHEHRKMIRIKYGGGLVDEGAGRVVLIKLVAVRFSDVLEKFY